ncbi:MAG: flagellar biosynthetic protein FliR, partial [Phycisphaerae bacterium]
LEAPVLGLMTGMLTAAFILALRVAAPVLIALFLASVALGFLSRTMPQMNILSVGFVIRAMLVLAVGGVAIGFSGDVLVGVLEDGVDTIVSHVNTWQAG